MFEPELGTLFPNNWLRPRFRFQAAHGENLFEITLRVPNQISPLRIYTRASGHIMAAALWKIIGRVGTGTVELTLRSVIVDAAGLRTAGPWSGSRGSFEVADVAAAGSIVYWTTSNGSSLRGFAIGDETTQSVLEPASVDANAKCVACHSSTPDGLYAGMTITDDANSGAIGRIAIRSVDGAHTEPPFVTDTARALLARTPQHLPSFSAAHWSPGDRLVLSNGRRILQANSNTELMWTDLEARSEAEGIGWGVVERVGDARAASGSAFSHDGTRIVYASADGVNHGVVTESTDARLFSVPFVARRGGIVTALTGSDDTQRAEAYPALSADDALVAYNRFARGGSYDNPAAEIYVVPSSGGASTRLAANDPPACTGKSSPGLTNSWPKWSPEVKASGPRRYYFLVFSSTRDPAAQGKPNLFVAPVVVEGGEMRSYAALSIWNQPVDEANHTPAWDGFQLPAKPIN